MATPIPTPTPTPPPPPQPPPALKLATPENLRLTPGNEEVGAEWDPVPDAQYYTVKKFAAGEHLSTLFPTTPSFLDRNVENGTEYMYEVFAQATGKDASDVTTGTVTPVAPPQTPPAGQQPPAQQGPQQPPAQGQTLPLGGQPPVQQPPAQPQGQQPPVQQPPQQQPPQGPPPQAPQVQILPIQQQPTPQQHDTLYVLIIAVCLVAGLAVIGFFIWSMATSTPSKSEQKIIIERVDASSPQNVAPATNVGGRQAGTGFQPVGGGTLGTGQLAQVRSITHAEAPRGNVDLGPGEEKEFTFTASGQQTDRVNVENGGYGYKVTPRGGRVKLHYPNSVEVVLEPGNPKNLPLLTSFWMESLDGPSTVKVKSGGPGIDLNP